MDVFLCFGYKFSNFSVLDGTLFFFPAGMLVFAFLLLKLNLEDVSVL